MTLCCLPWCWRQTHDGNALCNGHWKQVCPATARTVAGYWHGVLDDPDHEGKLGAFLGKVEGAYAEMQQKRMVAG